MYGVDSYCLIRGRLEANLGFALHSIIRDMYHEVLGMRIEDWNRLVSSEIPIGGKVKTSWEGICFSCRP